MGNKSSPKVATNFCCESCDYSTSKISNWKKHLSTQKHSMVINGNKSSQKVANLGKIEEYNCEFCGKNINFLQGYVDIKNSVLKRINLY